VTPFDSAQGAFRHWQSNFVVAERIRSHYEKETRGEEDGKQHHTTACVALFKATLFVAKGRRSACFIG
jgi:hypothetical protein